MISPRIQLRLLSAFASLCVGISAHGQTPQSEQAFKDASQSAIDAAVVIFQCLSAGKKDKSEAVLINQAIGLLKEASQQYAKLRRERGDKAFRPKGADVELTVKLIEDFNQDPQVKLSNKLETEGQVADLNKLSIDLLTRVIQGWHGSCSTPFKDRKKYIELIGAKVRVEKASQLGEIAFSTSMK
jgi:hypothetical protein